MKIKVKPREGVKVYDDRGQLIPISGATVEKTTRITRLIKMGDLRTLTSKKGKE